MHLSIFVMCKISCSSKSLARYSNKTLQKMATLASPRLSSFHSTNTIRRAMEVFNYIKYRAVLLILFDKHKFYLKAGTNNARFS